MGAVPLAPPGQTKVSFSWVGLWIAILLTVIAAVPSVAIGWMLVQIVCVGHR